jgi:hypothetical protein
MLKYGTIVLLAAALPVAAVNTAEAGWVKVGGHSVWIRGMGQEPQYTRGLPSGGLTLHPPPPGVSRFQAVLTAPALIHASATGRVATPMRRR